MTSDNHGIIEAGRAIRPYLADWFAPQDAAAFDQGIAALLTTANPADAGTQAGQLRALLEGHPHTGRFLRDVLADAPHYRPPDQQPRYQRTPRPSPLGDPGPVAADRYNCPRGDYTWYRPDLGSAIPTCPTHQVTLVRG
ncbi:hypothetical protein ThrDRAFT_00641 [Frankia casuarinae]|uniref:Uncharacterized protein n=1 Tax=Frankia casuarinae (strain DSM 45818 / CECT 9043 / HFP020203 / CcI3) TaxID=106370 RepID=Q2JGP0_FRACC|nr:MULTISPECIES: hypothetical protein [Frankia]ABD09552.1 hypothetical protein Francci3_0160 [Frankia casuarinae]ETA03752.1 hypothetical protein CcI6DRAFT_00909 [Frankia sp. CcI6]EYT93579.1 hypothetical protein ThrDRAFT_00641 [Frankia casuarinae]KDA43800.1 hypothetical protein BMG523Draft_01182 [Frankia sp. BMG5.23]KFB05398.1 hypothetical protein ALLO2DRAFT_01935 [Frankia sp. Allo2]